MFSDFVPKFVKHFANVGDEVKKGVAAYCGEVKAGTFPDDAHSFHISKEIVDSLK